jgi:hypothetical protein
MKLSALRIERLLAKVEALRARTRELSHEEWEKKYCTAGAGEREKK